MFRLKELLKSAGWTIPRSSDGITFNPSGDQITSSGSGAGGMANTSAWFVVKAPTTNRSLMVQRQGSNAFWIVNYSFSAGFTGGSAVVVPTATDGQVVNSGGVTTYNTDGTYRLQMMADNASPYGFYSAAYPIGGGLSTHVFMMDPLSEFISGDADPYVFYVLGGTPATNVLGQYNSASFGAISASNGTVTPMAWRNKGGGSETWGKIMGTFPLSYPFATARSLAGGYPVGNHLSGKRILYPMHWVVTAALGTAPGYKGTSGLLKVSLSPLSAGSTVTISSNKDRIIVGACALPWNGSDPLV